MLKYFANQPPFKRRKVSNGPNFAFVGSNLAFQAALIEAANTGLALGFSGPTAPPQYWLRGARYPNFLALPGATYTRTGSRAGLDAAVIYPANVPRVAAVNGLRVFGAGTNEARNSTATGGTVGVIGSGGVAPTSWSIQGAGLTREIVSITNDAVRIRYSGTPTSTFVSVIYSSEFAPALPAQVWTASRYARLVAGTLPAAALDQFNLAVYRYNSGSVYIDQSSSAQTFNGSTFVRGVHTTAALPAGTAFISAAWTINVNNGVPCDFTVEIASPQLEQSAFATDYIPNPNTGASSSAGADDAKINFTLPAECTIIAEWIEPPVTNFCRVIGAPGGLSPSPMFLENSTRIGAFNGAVALTGITAARAIGTVQRAVYRQTGAGRQLHYNGAQIAADANTWTSVTQLLLGSGDLVSDTLKSGITVASIIPRDIGATQANAVSVLP